MTTMTPTMTESAMGDDVPMTSCQWCGDRHPLTATAVFSHAIDHRAQEIELREAMMVASGKRGSRR